MVSHTGLQEKRTPPSPPRFHAKLGMDSYLKSQTRLDFSLVSRYASQSDGDADSLSQNLEFKLELLLEQQFQTGYLSAQGENIRSCFSFQAGTRPWSPVKGRARYESGSHCNWYATLTLGGLFITTFLCSL